MMYQASTSIFAY